MELGAELFRLTVYGQPAGAGSKTAQTLGKRGAEVRDRDGRIVLIYRPASKFTKPWMEIVEKEGRIGWGRRAPMDGALWIAIDCFEARPKAHYRSGGKSHLLRPDAPYHPAVTDTHDSGKLRRAIEDSLTNAEVLADDKRVVDGHDRKHYCDEQAAIFDGESWREPRAVVRVGRMLHQTVTDAGLVSPAPEGQVALV